MWFANLLDNNNNPAAMCATERVYVKSKSHHHNIVKNGLCRFDQACALYLSDAIV